MKSWEETEWTLLFKAGKKYEAKYMKYEALNEEKINVRTATEIANDVPWQGDFCDAKDADHVLRIMRLEIEWLKQEAQAGRELARSLKDFIHKHG